MADDADIAFKLQMEEALAASIHDRAGSSSSTAGVNYDAGSSSNTAGVNYDAVSGSTLTDILQDDNMDENEWQLLEQYMTEAEAVRLQLDLRREIHDRAFACEIASIPEEEWRNTGDNLSRPFGEGSSTSNGEGLGFRVYVKGLVEGMVGGVGVAICDGNNSLVFELSKGVSGKEKDHQANATVIEFKALIEALDVAVMLNLKRITIVTDNQLLYQCVSGKNPPMTANVATLSTQISLLLRKLTHPHVSLVAINEIKLAVELARKAIASQVNRLAGSRKPENLTECCTICFEDTHVDQMFLIPSCQHSYCFSCMSKHVQFKLLQGILPKCPHAKCNSMLKLDSCKKFLSPELFDIMSQCEKEASIPAAEKIYCPNPHCSSLLSKTELQGSIGNFIEELGCRRCPRCRDLFCINCKVHWHTNMSCFDFKRQNPYSSDEEKKLKNMATQQLWRQCPKCNHMVSLASGCYHIYCRCGHEFCYTCGAEWKNKKPTCTCPIWDERNIVDQQNRR